jgi:hypothetical protein
MAAFAHLFMNTTKEQIQQLTPEQQEALGSIAIKRDTIRLRLLKQRGHYRAVVWLPIVLMMPLYLAPMLITNPKYLQLSIFCVAMCLWVLIQFHAAGVNRRVDALVELMEDGNAA